ncbi:hypothetical protein SCLCIDRAFT_106521 [Scleroderma citrinum Foug A]|uniref:Uncharacterized protein n=1 Tax=Scleroderma citrinum Foug A TaxID=1036808 RepID=A0A0C3ASU8_9AGAM|nr:hypothetical protein SCLCIDRAFT_106521 [Scleroderma citrinum Foug A]
MNSEPLTRSAFIKHLKYSARAAAADSIDSHGISIGGTLVYLLRGIQFKVTKVRSRWTSVDNFTFRNN